MARLIPALAVGWLVLYWRIDEIPRWLNHFTTRHDPIHVSYTEVPMIVVIEIIGALVLFAVLVIGLSHLDDYFKKPTSNHKDGESK
jgi:hypothetical protein